jgi:UDP-N-acetylmuramoyl-L-alanyl-D-glutamate--2,6-diaminopimelate ligase
MGFAAAKKAKHIYLTSDNPRHEEPMAIIEDILAGIDQKDKVTIEPDREKAIALALKNLNDNEVLLVLGKGDEKIQEIGDSIHPFSDKTIILKYLNQKDY